MEQPGGDDDRTLTILLVVELLVGEVIEPFDVVGSRTLRLSEEEGGGVERREERGGEEE